MATKITLTVTLAAGLALTLGVSSPRGAEGAIKPDSRCVRPSDLAPAPPATASADKSWSAERAMSQLALRIVENQGQCDRRADYYIPGARSSVYFSPEGIVYSYSTEGGRARRSIKLEFVGARRDVRPRGYGQTETTVSYFKGRPDQWKSGLRTFTGVEYEQMWPGIDLHFEGSDSGVRYRFEVAPGSDPAHIRLAYRSSSGDSLDEVGQLMRSTADVLLAGHCVASVHRGSVSNRVASSRWSRDASAGIVEVGFRLGDYDTNRTLVLEPTEFAYAGYVGGDSFDVGVDVAVDGAGCAYVVGQTSSSEATFPVLNGPDSTFAGSSDAFIAKVNAAGTSLVYAGYIGGSGDDTGYSVAVDSSGQAYVVGPTSSSESTFPVLVGPDLTFNDGVNVSDGFVAKLDATGTALLYCGYIGGDEDDGAYGVAVDSAGQAFVTGQTGSMESTFPDGDGFGSLGGPDTTFNGDRDAFVAKVNAAGTALMYAGYVGGSDGESGSDIDVDAAGCAFLTGMTTSSEATFPDGDGFGTVGGADLTMNGNGDAFIIRVNLAGDGLDYASYVGGSQREEAGGIAVAVDGSVVVVGLTSSTQATFPDGDGGVSGPDSTYNGGLFDAFVAKLDATGLAFSYAGYIGGSGNEVALGVAVDSDGNAYVCGDTSSTQASFPDGDGFGLLSGPDTSFNGESDAFVVKVNSAGTALVYAGYIGGSGVDKGEGIAVDFGSNAFITGETRSAESSFPDGDGFGSVGGPDSTFNGGFDDAFVVKVVDNHPSDTIGVYVQSTGSWFLKNTNAPGAADLVFNYGAGGMGVLPIRGDWNGDGVDTAGLYFVSTGAFFLRNANSPGPADLVFTFGAGGGGVVPVTGDWNGDGTDTVGLYVQGSGTFFLRNVNMPGPADVVFTFGAGGPGVLPVVGDWNNDNTDSVGIYVQSAGVFFLKNTNTPGGADLVIGFGPTGMQWQPASGDFNADGRDTIGLFDPVSGTFFLRNLNQPGPADLTFGYGPVGAAPLVGDWDGL